MAELAHAEQLGTWSDPARNPTRRELATGYLGLVPADAVPQLPPDTSWHPVDALPLLAFDHDELVLAGRERLRGKLSYTNVAFALAPPAFTISELRDSVRRRARPRGVGDEPEARAPAPRTCSRRRAAGETRAGPAAAPRRSTASALGGSRSPIRSPPSGRRRLTSTKPLSHNLRGAVEAALDS